MSKALSAENNSVSFADNEAIQANRSAYAEVVVNTAAILKSWKLSLYSFEWMRPDGTIKSMDELPFREQERRRAVEDALQSGQSISRPVLGIGLMDNVEIGAGRAEFLTLAARGYHEIPVYIPKSCEKDFKPFIKNGTIKG